MRGLVGWTVAVCVVFAAWFVIAMLVAQFAPPIQSGPTIIYRDVPAKCEPRIVTETKVVKVPVVEKIIDHRVPASVKRELRALRRRVWVDRQNLATAYLPR